MRCRVWLLEIECGHSHLISLYDWNQTRLLALSLTLDHQDMSYRRMSGGGGSGRVTEETIPFPLLYSPLLTKQPKGQPEKGGLALAGSRCFYEEMCECVGKRLWVYLKESERGVCACTCCPLQPRFGRQSFGSMAQTAKSESLKVYQ